ncbi:hypothetical protein [Wolbachia endosymbiont (group A) of Lypha dubia]|uniref:hypothetical protein n=1 Tax=Wolbachia endosymbiont (group A) of Lypha dubia TaxID=3066146 RepID=UPI00334029B0
MRDTQLYEHCDLRTLHQESWIPVPRHWDPAFHATSSKAFIQHKISHFLCSPNQFAYLQAKFPGFQCQALE